MGDPQQKINFNLNYRFAADLREIPEDKDSMLAYAEFMMSEAKKLQKAGVQQNLRALVKFLGEAGTYYRLLEKTEAAANALEQSLALIEQYKLGINYWAVHTIRYGEVLQQKQDYLGAETAFKAVYEIAERHPDLEELKDFCLQHLGKLYFAQKDYKKARPFFTQALQIRQNKGDKQLIGSTEFAIRALDRKAP